MMDAMMLWLRAVSGMTRRVTLESFYGLYDVE